MILWGKTFSSHAQDMGSGGLKMNAIEPEWVMESVVSRREWKGRSFRHPVENVIKKEKHLSVRSHGTGCKYAMQGAHV